MLSDSAAEGFMERRAGREPASVDFGWDGNGKDELRLRKPNLGKRMCLREENVIQDRLVKYLFAKGCVARPDGSYRWMTPHGERAVGSMFGRGVCQASNQPLQGAADSSIRLFIVHPKCHPLSYAPVQHQTWDLSSGNS